MAINGSCHSKFQISVYEKSSGNFIVEGNRLRVSVISIYVDTSS